MAFLWTPVFPATCSNDSCSIWGEYWRLAFSYKNYVADNRIVNTCIELQLKLTEAVPTTCISMEVKNIPV